MPSLTFVMPHWLYWLGLILFPAAAAYFAMRQEKLKPKPGQVSSPIAYLLLITGGFVGLHRFYLRAFQAMALFAPAALLVVLLLILENTLASPVVAGALFIAAILGFLIASRAVPVLRGFEAFSYIAAFVLILYGNRQSRFVRVEVSNAKNDLLGAEYDLELAQKAVAAAAEGAAEKLTQAQQALEALQPRLIEVTATWEQWGNFSGMLAALILVGLIVDAFLLPRLTRECSAREAASGKVVKEIHVAREAAPEDPTALLHTRFTDSIDRLSGISGNFVCYWSLIAVFVYYYEVVARYVFNSPTNWAHEGMFLMFGMQYLLAGAFTLREDSHVRVDVIYVYFPEKVKAIVDIVTSVFFFIFSIALMVTGAIFALDSIEVLEVSFTEWAIQYWPVKITLALGGLLLTLQGLAKLTKDIILLKGLSAKEA